MSEVLSNLKPSSIWKHFAKILKIPHCSGNEKALGDYVIQVAERNKLEYKRDKVGNIVVRKKAYKGHEGAEGVILQGHMDMVCEKNSDVDHDFSKDPIQVELKGDWLQAKGTTLGADNGIGVASALAVMEDKDIVHGPLEFLFTVDEETGLTGATQIKRDFLKGKKLLNLDSEDEGSFTIGCAGGADSEITLPLKREQKKKEDGVRLKISGFRGGHSGLDINQGRGNAIKLLTRLIWETYNQVPFELISLEGGNKRNAIPREAYADVVIQKSQQKEFQEISKKAFEDIRHEFKSIEKEAEISFSSIKTEIPPLTEKSRRALINLLLVLPHGVISMHPDIEGLVETSSNLAIVNTHKEKAEIICSSRSSISSSLRATREVIKVCCELAGADVKQPEGYPGWTPDLESPLLKTLKKVYSELFDKEPEVEAVHAGLECGIIGEKFPGMDMISFGPTIKNPHSPEERIQISSVEKFYRFLLKTLETLA